MADEKYPKLTVEQYNDIANGGWSYAVPWEVAEEAHKRNIKSLKEAFAEYEKEDRPLRILAIHGSGRANVYGSFGDSNSKYLLQQSLEIVKDIDAKIEIEEVQLTDYNIAACYNCVAVTSGGCGAPCDCHPVDGMQELYPKLLRSDIHFCSTGVNQSTMSSRLKLMVDRMISLDGGFHREELREKDDEFFTEMMQLAKEGNVAYDQRLYGRVGGYFITSKDVENQHKTVNHLKEQDVLAETNYIRLTAYTLKDNFESYGYFHDPVYWTGAAADADIDYMYDRETLENNKQAIARGKEVVENAITLSKHLKTNLPEFKPDRINRT